MHIADQQSGNLGANAIVGGSAGIATGAALSAQMRGSGQVAVCFFGEGALGQGLLYEVMNMASLWKLPVVYVCENNLYSEYTHYRETTAGSVTRARRGVRDPGRDGRRPGRPRRPRRRAGGRSSARGAATARASSMCETYRLHGHHVGDVDRAYYRSREEEATLARRSAIRSRCTAPGCASRASPTRTSWPRSRRACAPRVEAGVAFALAAPVSRRRRGGPACLRLALPPSRCATSGRPRADLRPGDQRGAARGAAPRSDASS